jgi:transcription antitermination factor NusG
MKKNWYVIYSKPQFEKKIVAVCNKKKLENYFPLKKVNKDPKKGKETYEPLFISFIFIHCTEPEINDVKKIDGVLSIMYFKDKPAVVNAKEILAIKDFTSIYENIQVEQVAVNLHESVTNISNSLKSADGNVFSINSKIMKMKLPSLGYNLIAEIDVDPVFGRAEFNFKNDFISRKLPD